MRRLLPLLLIGVFILSCMGQSDDYIFLKKKRKFGASASGEPTFTDVQGKWGTTDTGGGTTVSVTLTSAPTTGNAVLCLVTNYPLTLVATVADNATSPNSYTATTHSPSNSGGHSGGATAAWIFYLLNVPAGAGSTITATFTGGTITFDTVIGCEEFHRSGGTWSFDTDAAGTNSAAGTAINTPSITSSVAGELEFFGGYGQGIISSVNSPWSLCSAGLGGLGPSDPCGYILSSSGSSTAVNATQSSGDWDTMAAAFK